MSKPDRNASPIRILSASRVFFATTKTSMGRNLLQSDRNANLLTDVLRSLVAEQKLKLHDFVIMPNHIHVLLEVNADSTIEKTMQFIKGRFSHRLTKEFGSNGEIWQRGFTDSQVMNRESFLQHRAYIANNPVKAGLVDSPARYPYCFGYLAAQKLVRDESSGAKAHKSEHVVGTTEVVPFHRTITPGFNVHPADSHEVRPGKTVETVLTPENLLNSEGFVEGYNRLVEGHDFSRAKRTRSKTGL